MSSGTNLEDLPLAKGRGGEALGVEAVEVEVEPRVERLPGAGLQIAYRVHHASRMQTSNSYANL